MIPPDQNMQQAMQMRQAMQPQGDPLLQALSRQSMVGDMMKTTADHKMKMLKIKAKYGKQMQSQGPQGPGY